MDKEPITILYFFNKSYRPFINKKSKVNKGNLVLDRHLKEIMVGLLLGDGNMQTFSKTGSTWRIIILQGGDNHFEYVKHLREIFDKWTIMPAY